MKGKTLNTTVSNPVSENKWDGKPTSGKWRVVNSGGMITSERDNGYFIIAILETEPLRISPEVEANARLIAAAPDMIETLKDSLATLYRWQDSDEWDERDELTLHNIKAAIAKATNNQ